MIKIHNHITGMLMDKFAGRNTFNHATSMFTGYIKDLNFENTFSLGSLVRNFCHFHINLSCTFILNCNQYKSESQQDQYGAK